MYEVNVKIESVKFSKIVIIDSLGLDESIDTAKYIHDYLITLVQHFDIPVELVKCANYIDFKKIMINLKNEVVNHNEIPIIHVESHGSDSGLIFDNGSEMGWEEVANLLTNVNIETKFNLLAVFSACFGGYFVGEIKPIKSAPCWCAIAPTQEVFPDELLNGFRIFYKKLFDTLDVGIASKTLDQTKLSSGKWFTQPIELWFEELMINYAKQYCLNNSADKQLKILFRRMKAEGTYVSKSFLKRLLKNEHKNLVEKYFEVFYSTKVVPENNQRFYKSKVKILDEYCKLKSTKKYLF